MGPLATLLTLPASGPLAALTWLARQIANIADQEMLDPKRIETALLALERRLDAGEIDEEAFEAEEANLLIELEEIRAARRADTAADEAPQEAGATPATQPETAPQPAAIAPNRQTAPGEPGHHLAANSAP